MPTFLSKSVVNFIDHVAWRIRGAYGWAAQSDWRLGQIVESFLEELLHMNR
ncbi:MAG: hypothetical protein ACXVBB_10780 [Isosphaeraceae bacterium]